MCETSARDEDLLDRLRLKLVPGIGPRIQQTLDECFETPGDVLSANADVLCQVPGVGRKLAQAIINARDSAEAKRELTRCRNLGVRLFLRDTAEYPRMLAEICDAPNIFYCRGNLEERDELAVGIVGSRRATLYGKKTAQRLAGSLARAGITVVSGMARGIDAVAHRAALEAGGRTIAVAATGLQVIYPPEHGPLSEEIAAQGAVITEFPLDQPPLPGLFPQRNRIISGLSLGVIIVEASRRSGALHTARHAMEQGREVFAVPGQIDSLASEGCHDLIRDGVALIRNVDDVLEALGPLMGPVRRGDGEEEVHSPRELTLTDQERQVLNQLTTESTHIDQVLRASDLESSRVLATLTVLEMKRMVRRLPGGYFVRVTH